MEQTKIGVYGYVQGSGKEVIQALSQVSICFGSSADMRAFAKFVLEAADGLESEPSWDHEHFNDWKEDHTSPDIILSKLHGTVG